MAANQGASTSSAASGAAQEFIVRVPKADKKRYHVMKFNASHKIEFGKWNQARLERENNFKEFKPGEEMPKFGAGSEYGRENREEARKKKFGIKASKRKLDDQPWCLRVGGKAGKKYRGIREGGVTENASYYVFTQAPDGAFEAFPIEEWYNFTPVRTYRTLNAEEAEEEFGKRDKVFNYFSIMMKKRLKNEDPDVDPDGEEKSKKGAKKKPKSGDFKISEMDDWVNSSDEEEEDEDEDETEGKDKKKPVAEKGKAKKKPVAKKGAKKKKKGKESDDSEALEDSDDGDDEGREVDYFSDESSESEADDERGGKGGKDGLKGVEDEEAIRKMEDSESEEEDGANKKDAAALEDAVKDEGGTGAPAAGSSGAKEKEKAVAKDKKDKKNGGSSSSSSSDTSDSDDFDNDTSFQTPLFMQDKITGSSKKQSKKSKKEHAAAANKSNAAKASDKGAGKRAATESDVKEVISNKRIKLESQASSSASPSAASSISIDGISEESIRRYLMRKPLTASELLQKFKSKKTGLSSEHLVNTIAQILKRLNPDKQTVKGKMYLSIRP